jgi:rare lipoprotein A
MNRLTGATVALMLFALAGCAHHTPLAAPAPTPPLRPAEPVPVPPPPMRPSKVSPQQPSAEEAVFAEKGLASLYAARFHGRATANGERYDKLGFTAAHRTLAFGTIVRVTNTANGRVVKVQINDRGPHVKSRVIDLSTAAARALGFRKGLARVRLEVFQSDQPAATKSG